MNALLDDDELVLRVDASTLHAAGHDDVAAGPDPDSLLIGGALVADIPISARTAAGAITSATLRAHRRGVL
jgi:hypothetical protein